MTGAAPSAAGYSGRPVAEKLGYREGQVAAFIALPPALAGLAAGTGFGARVESSDWSAALGDRRFDLIHAFTTRQAEIDAHLSDLQAALKPAGMVWVSWPKKAAKLPTDVTEDTIRAAALRLDLVDVKVAAVDAVWSALKLVIRRDRR